MVVLSDVKWLVIKIGFVFFVDWIIGVLCDDWLKSFVEDVVWFKGMGKDIIIVFLGFIVLGCGVLLFGNKDLLFD